MTQSNQKASERFLVEETKRLLGKGWHLEEREKPDFIVTDGEERFGLEVCEIFAGKHSKKGSKMKKEEAERQKKIFTVRRKYGEIEKISLWLDFHGEISDENIDRALNCLLKENLSTKKFPHKINIEVGKGAKKLKIHGHVRSKEPSRWKYVSDQVGWLDAKSTEYKIIEKINEKSKKLIEYKKCTNLDDIRLLVFSNRIKNSGKLALREEVSLELKGFKAVYFCSYPEKVSVFRECAPSHVCRRDYPAG